MTASASRRRVDVPLLLKFHSELMLFLAGSRFPGEVENLVWRPQMIFWRAVAIETPFHTLRFVLKDDPHFVNGTVARIAAHTSVHVDRMVKVRIVRNAVNFHPVDRRPIALAAIPSRTNGFQFWTLRLDLLVTPHARLRRRHIRMRSYFHETMAIPAVHAKLLNVKIMLKWHRLRGLVANPGILGCEIVRNSASYGRPEHSNAYRQLPRKLIRPLWEEICHR